ncbi:hypothetical protein [Legionella brunensis]|uniref:Bacterial transferase hexapeptide (Six repeats) n=1 Tax=Legionella brunensis TaxID=29422 RepID=A0A0W0S3I4_9GAMM|nr:hypothetical protein [Legionella brunensis]KTC77976.1 Bacterial transferase hexapeptide (six repeats) [Legionella brunensis]
MKNLKSRAEKIIFAQNRINGYRSEKSFIHPSVSIPNHVIIGKNVIIHENCTLGTEYKQALISADDLLVILL